MTPPVSGGVPEPQPTLEEVAAMAKGIDADGQRLMVNAARSAGWSPEQFAEMYYRASHIGGRDVVITICEMAYDL